MCYVSAFDECQVIWTGEEGLQQRGPAAVLQKSTIGTRGASL